MVKKIQVAQPAQHVHIQEVKTDSDWAPAIKPKNLKTRVNNKPIFQI